MPSVVNEVRGQTELAFRWRMALPEYVTSLAMGDDGRLGVVGLGDGHVVGVALDDGRSVFERRAHDGSVLGVSLSPDGERLVTCGSEASASLWLATGEKLADLPGGGTSWVEHVAWAPVGSRIATAAGRRVRVWTGTGEPLVETDALASTVTGLAWRADGRALAVCCYGGVHVLPCEGNEPGEHLAWKGSLVSLAWSPNGKVIACGSQDGSVHFWRLPSGVDSEMTGYRFKPKALAFSHDSSLLATSGDAVVTTWDFRGRGPEGTRPILLSGHKALCTRLAFAPRKGILASGGQDTSVLLWEPRRGTRPRRYAFLEDEITALAWHPREPILFAGDARGTLAAWDVR